MWYMDGFPVPEVGDIVLVKSDLVAGDIYKNLPFDNKDSFITPMNSVKGQYVTISQITGDNKFIIRESDCYWTTEMFDLSQFEIKVSISKNDLMEFLK